MTNEIFDPAAYGAELLGRDSVLYQGREISMSEFAQLVGGVVLVAMHTEIVDGKYGVPIEVENETGLPRR